MNNPKDPKSKKQIKHANVLESLKDIGSSTANSIKKDLVTDASRDFIQELLGTRQKKVSGEIIPGEAMEMEEAMSPKSEEIQKYKKQASLERKLRVEEKELSEKKGNELRLQLKALQEEILALSISTQSLAEESKVAAMQAPIEPGVYHVIFFEKLLEFVKSFRKKIDEASIWLQSTNKRAEKKNYWTRYKKHGSKFLLSPDHYLSRSAG